MNARLFRAAALALTFAAGIQLSACGTKTAASGDGPGLAAGLTSKQSAAEIWKRLAAYDHGYLEAWKDVLSDPDPSPRDVLDAFNELAFAITGPAGFWRKTVPERWLGCQADPDTPVCKALVGASAARFEALDKLQAEIAELPAGKESTFLAKHGTELLAYLDAYVPATPSMSAMRDTGFFKDTLAQKLDAVATRDDL